MLTISRLSRLSLLGTFTVIFLTGDIQTTATARRSKTGRVPEAGCDTATRGIACPLKTGLRCDNSAIRIRW